MDNHYHLLLETPRGNLSQILHHINRAYTNYVNTKRNRSGHLFQGRYKAIVVEKDPYLLELSHYIHLNPVRAGLVENPSVYRWSSYPSERNRFLLWHNWCGGESVLYKIQAERRHTEPSREKVSPPSIKKSLTPIHFYVYECIRQSRKTSGGISNGPTDRTDSGRSPFKAPQWNLRLEFWGGAAENPGAGPQERCRGNWGFNRSQSVGNTKSVEGTGYEGFGRVRARRSWNRSQSC